MKLGGLAGDAPFRLPQKRDAELMTKATTTGMTTTRAAAFAFVPSDDDDDDAGGGAAGRRATTTTPWCGTHRRRQTRSTLSVAAHVRGPLPLGTDPVDGDGDGGVIGRGAVARSLAAAPFAAGEGGGALLAVAHQRVVADERDERAPGVSRLRHAGRAHFLQEPSPAWAALSFWTRRRRNCGRVRRRARVDPRARRRGRRRRIAPAVAGHRPSRARERRADASKAEDLRRGGGATSSHRSCPVVWDPSCRDECSAARAVRFTA